MNEHVVPPANLSIAEEGERKHRNLPHSNSDGWTYDFGEPAIMQATGKLGHIAGRAERFDGREDYYVRYEAGGHATAYQWLSASDLRPVHCTEPSPVQAAIAVLAAGRTPAAENALCETPALTVADLAFKLAILDNEDTLPKTFAEKLIASLRRDADRLAPAATRLRRFKVGDRVRCIGDGATGVVIEDDGDYEDCAPYLVREKYGACYFHDAADLEPAA